jgi:phage tail P2-like protein
VPSILPASIASESYLRLEQVLEQRFDAIDLTKLLVYLIDHVDASALPALAWQFRALGPAWTAATSDEERRGLLRRVLARRRHRGTPWAIRDVLEPLYGPIHIQEDTRIRYDGTIQHNGLFRYGYDAHWARFWVIVSDAAASSAESIVAAVNEWGRASTELAAVYFVDAPPGPDFRGHITSIHWAAP